MNCTTNNINMDRIWLDGIMGVVTGDALGCPVQFLEREEVGADPVTGMRGFGTYDMPPGTWTDDSSMTLAALAGIKELGKPDPEDIMDRFVSWLRDGEYTPFGEPFDIGRGTLRAIVRYMQNGDPESCGGTTDHDNGNGSLMRIMPVCLYCYMAQKSGNMSDAEAVSMIHSISGLTHNHLRAQIACGLYFFMIRALLDSDQDLIHRLQKGLDEGFGFYGEDPAKLGELSHYGRLRNLFSFRAVPEEEIRSSGYVVDTIEATVWCLIGSDSFEDALLKAVNLGEDTDTVGAIAGGLAGLYYGYEDIPKDWLAAIQRRDWIEDLCRDIKLK